MSDIVGGYYAELKLLTDASSFEKGRKQLEDMTRAGEKAVVVFSALQRITGGSGSSGGERWVGGGGGGFGQKQIGYEGGIVKSANSIGGGRGGGYGPSDQQWRYAGNNYGQKPPSLPPGSGGGGGGGGGDDGGTFNAGGGDNASKKAFLQKAALIYAVVKVTHALVKVTEALWALTATTAKDVQKSTTSATLMGMTSKQYETWKGAYSTAKLDFGSFEAGATNIENAYRALKVGDVSRYTALAKPMAQLGLNIASMHSMGNDERMKTIFDAALKMYNQGGAKSELAYGAMEQMFGQGGQEWLAFMNRPGAQKTGVGQFLSMSGGVENLTAKSGKDIANAEDFSKLETLLNGFKTLLGMKILNEIDPVVKEITAQLEDPTIQAKIKKAFAGIGKFFAILLKIMEVVGTMFMNAFAQLDDSLTKIEAQLKAVEEDKTPGAVGAVKRAFMGLNAGLSILKTPADMLVAGVFPSIAPGQYGAPSSKSSEKSIVVNIGSVDSAERVKAVRDAISGAARRAVFYDAQLPVRQPAGVIPNRGR
jgi:hypothetical protein